MINFKQQHYFIVCLLGIIFFLPQLAVGANVVVKVSVIQSTCTINNNQIIEVDFQEVLTTRVDGTNYRQPIPYTIACKGTEGNNALKLQIEGTGAGFNRAVLQTNVAPLGIRLENSSKEALNLNEWLNFDYPKVPLLWAVPVAEPGKTLTPGRFYANSIMKVEYR